MRRARTKYHSCKERTKPGGSSEKEEGGAKARPATGGGGGAGEQSGGGVEAEEDVDEDGGQVQTQYIQVHASEGALRPPELSVKKNVCSSPPSPWYRRQEGDFDPLEIPM